MKAKQKDFGGETESLGEFCVRSFSREPSPRETGRVSLYSGVPVLRQDAGQKSKGGSAFGARGGKVIT